MAWETRPLAELCAINVGRTPSRDELAYWGEGWPWLSIADMNQGRELKVTKEQITTSAAKAVMGPLVPVGTVALSFKLSIGKVGITQIPMYTNEAIATLPVKDSEVLDSEFLYWALRTINLMAETDDAAMGKTLNKAKLARLQIPVPPSRDQHRIVDILNRVDAQRARRRATIVLLDDLVQSAFIDLFGDPRTNPRGFTQYKLSALVGPGERINYGVVQPGENFSGGVPLIRVGDLIAGRVNNASLKLIHPAIESKYPRSRLKGNEVLVGCVGSIGVVALATPAEAGFNIARAVARIPVASDTDRRYIAECLKTASVQDYFVRESRTVAQPTLNIKQLTETPVLWPPESLRAQFVAQVTAVESLKERHLAYLKLLDTLFASLQHNAFRGEL